MSNVNSRIQNFYNRGHQAAVDEIMDFLDQLADRLGDRTLPQDMTARKFIKTLMDPMSKHFGRSEVQNKTQN